MSEGDVWYFARGQEVVGPFSREILRQIHAGGQLPLDVLVWREGMEGWKPAGQVAELGLGSTTPAPPSKPAGMPPPALARAAAPAPPSSPAPAPEAPRLKLRVKSTEPAPPGANPTTTLRKSLAPDGVSFPPAQKKRELEPVPIAGHGPRKKPSAWQRTISRVFSSIVMAPLFLIAAAVLALMCGKDFPNILGLLWIFAAFGVFGVVSLFGLRGFDALFRWLGLVVMAPPVAMLWDVIMRERPLAQVTPAEWFFLGLCLLYCMTMRIGLRAYPGGIGNVAVGTGLVTLGVLLAIAKTDLEKGVPGWEKMVQRGAEIRLPGTIARWLNMPGLGTREGTLRLRLGKEEEEVGIERAVLEPRGTGEWRFTILALDGKQYTARMKGELAALLEKETSLVVSAAGFTSREGLDEVDSLAVMRTFRFRGKDMDLAGASIRFAELGREKARGTITVVIGGQKEPVTIVGEFETKMIQR